MRALESIGVRSFRHSLGRYVLTIVGIMLGVAVAFGVLVANDTMAAAFSRQLSGDRPPVVNIQPAGAYGAGVPSGLVEDFAQLPDVQRVTGSLGFTTFIPGEEGSDWAFVAGTKLAGAEWEPDPDDPYVRHGREPEPGASEVSMPDWIAERLGASLGSDVVLFTPTGDRTLTVTMLVERVDGEPNERRGIGTSIQTVQALAGRGEVVEGIEVHLHPGNDPGRWMAAHRDALGEGVRVSRAGEGLWSSNMDGVIDVIRSVFAGLAAVALFVGAFLIYLTLSMSVAERTRVYGTMRALGASRDQVRRVVLSEALALGVAATVAGIVLGTIAAFVIIEILGRVYQVDVPQLVIGVPAVGAALVLGLAVTLISALVPARRAARLSPVTAIRGDERAQQRLSRWWMAGAPLIVAGVAFPSPSGAWLFVGTIFILLGSVLLVPVVLRPISRAVGRVTRRLSPGVGDVGVMHLVKERSRSAYTLALVMVVLAMVFTIGAGQRSLMNTVDASIDAHRPADIVVLANALDEEAVATIASVPGTEALTAMRFGETSVMEATHERTIGLVIVDADTYFDVQGFPFVEGANDAARAALTAGGGVILPEGLALDLRASVGDGVELRTIEGWRQFTMAGSYISTDTIARVIVGLPDGLTWFGAGPPAAVALKLSDAADAGPAVDAIESGLAGVAGARVQVTADRQAEFRAEVDGYFRVFYSVVLIAAIIGLLGLANTMVASIVARTREIGLLRAIGSHRSQVRAMVVVEALTLTAVALVLAVPLGWIISSGVVQAGTEAVGLVIRYTFPWRMVPVLSALACVIALLAAASPARRAASVDPVVSLRFD